MLSIGSVVGASVDFGTKTIDGKRAYLIPLALFFVAPTIQAVFLVFFPESPRWLMVQGREAEAEKSLRRLRNPNIDEHQLQAELNEIRGSTREQLEQNKKWLFVEMWRGTNLRRTVLSICVVCFHCANGIPLSQPGPKFQSDVALQVLLGSISTRPTSSLLRVYITPSRSPFW